VNHTEARPIALKIAELLDASSPAYWADCLDSEFQSNRQWFHDLLAGVILLIGSDEPTYAEGRMVDNQTPGFLALFTEQSLVHTTFQYGRDAQGRAVLDTTSMLAVPLNSVEVTSVSAVGSLLEEDRDDRFAYQVSASLRAGGIEIPLRGRTLSTSDVLSRILAARA
jgi:hypothetical protein